MNKYIYSAAAFLSLSCIALTSCQNEMEQIGAPAGKEVLLRVTANRGDAETRTTLEPNGTGGLTCNWSEDDQLLVVNDGDGKKLGVITLIDGAETSLGTFEGQVTLDGHETVTLVYLGTAADPSTYSADANSIELNVSAQDGALASLTQKDVLTGQVYVDNNAYVYKKDDVIETTVTLTRQLSYGYFTLSLPDNLTLAANDVITISGNGLKSEAKVNFKNGGGFSILTGDSYKGSTSITITKTEDGNDFYVTMLPIGNVTPTFTVEKNGYIYTASLGQHNWVRGEFVRKNTNGDPVEVTEWTKKSAKLDGTIFGIKWAPENTHSYIDADKTKDTYVYVISYIPTVSFEEQDITFEHANPALNEYLEGDLTYAYHYQWDRDFGFIASTEDYYEYAVDLPNWDNLPAGLYSSVYGRYCYTFSNSQQSLSNGHKNFEVYNYPSRYNDWCSTANRTTWGDRSATNNNAAWPKGFDLPTKAQLQTLLPENKEGTYDSFAEIEMESGCVLRPFFIKNLTDGTAVVWSIMETDDNNYMDVRRLVGNYSETDLNATNMVTDVAVQFCASGHREGLGVNDYYLNGIYWAKDCPSGTASGKAPCFGFTLNAVNNPTKISVKVGDMVRKNAASLRCIYAN